MKYNQGSQQQTYPQLGEAQQQAYQVCQAYYAQCYNPSMMYGQVDPSAQSGPIQQASQYTAAAQQGFYPPSVPVPVLPVQSQYLQQQQQSSSCIDPYYVGQSSQGKVTGYKKSADEDRLSSDSGSDKKKKSEAQKDKSKQKKKSKDEKKKKKRRHSVSSSDSSSRSRSIKKDRPKQLPKHLQSEGNWKCKECNNINFPNRTHCNRCKLPKEQAWDKKRKDNDYGKKDVKRGYQPNPDDWKCNLCGNFNFARREKCNRCKEDKAKCMESNSKSQEHRQD